ncbi:MAG TPA: putative Ig domain-containing protein [archaeon]|nr:putative Ig domain-containing protein [archaeon]
MSKSKKGHRLYGIAVLVIIGIVLVSGCVEKSTEGQANSIETKDNPVEELWSDERPTTNINKSPILDTIGNKIVNEGNTLTFTINASDPDNDVLTYSASNLPSGAIFNAVTQTFSWTPTQAKGSYKVAFTVSDGNLSDSETITITVEPPAESTTKHFENTSLSGKSRENQIWSGEILIIGDTHIDGDLTILSGTVVKFAVGDNVGWGNEILPDGYNDLDPTRLKNYEVTHSDISVSGKLIAKGTPDKRIIFTSAASKPDYADWVGIHIGADKSIMEYSIVEWSRHGIGLGNNIPNTIIRNNIINHTLWGSISSGYSSAQIYGNEIWESGHEGIDVQGGDPTIENNKIYNVHTGIVILSGSATVKNNVMINVGDGIYTASGATPILENNHVELAPSDSKLKWSYGNFSYVMFGNPIIKK